MSKIIIRNVGPLDKTDWNNAGLLSDSTFNEDYYMRTKIFCLSKRMEILMIFRPFVFPADRKINVIRESIRDLWFSDKKLKFV